MGMGADLPRQPAPPDFAFFASPRDIEVFASFATFASFA